MSRAFLKSDTVDDPVLIPPRAPLPPGVPNYVTPRGLQLLRAELTDLETERVAAQAEPDESERTRRLALLNGRIGDLNQRIATAKLVEPQPHAEVRFGATVTLQTLNGKMKGTERRFTLVGVDEADAARGLVAFTTPIARAVLGRKVGEQTSLRMGAGEELEVIRISYAVDGRTYGERQA
jgi:transcription elongation factor GreB